MTTEKMNIEMRRYHRETAFSVFNEQYPSMLTSLRGSELLAEDAVLNEYLTYFCCEPNGIGTPPRLCPAGYSYAEVSWPREVLCMLQAFLSPTIVGTGVLLCPEADQTFGIRASLFDLGEMVTESFDVFRAGAMLISEDKSIGFGWHEVVGYLEADPNPDEVLYEIGKWRNSR